MKARTITIGKYHMSPAVPFCLYQLPSPLVTPPRSLSRDQRQDYYFNYFCLEDLFHIFDLHSIRNDLLQYFQQFPGFFFKDIAGKAYIKTQLMADIALKHNLCALYDLCLLDEEEILKGGAIPLLKSTFVRLNPAPTLAIIESFEPKPLNGHEWFFNLNDSTSRQNIHPHIKLEPLSPTLPSPKTTDAAILSPLNSPRRTLQLSFESSSSLPSMNNDSRSVNHLSSPPPFTQFTKTNKPNIKLPKPSQLLLKRLTSCNGSRKNLTISTPSYRKDFASASSKLAPHYGIHTAPLRRSTYPPMSQLLHQQQQQQVRHKIVKKSPTISAIQNRRDSNLPPLPASATSWSSNTITTRAIAKDAEDINTTNANTRFPSPPIVPSQQPAWDQYRQLRQQHLQQQQQQQQRSKARPTKANSTGSYFPPVQPENLSAKQKFLQPFEYLFDQIEQTRHLKSTLDDQIRRSSTLLQTLQSSSTTVIEPLIRRQVRQHMLDPKMEKRLQQCYDRISRLEHRVMNPKNNHDEQNGNENVRKPEQEDDSLIQDLLKRIEQLEDKYHCQE